MRRTLPGADTCVTEDGSDDMGMDRGVFFLSQMKLRTFGGETCPAVTGKQAGEGRRAQGQVRCWWSRISCAECKHIDSFRNSVRRQRSDKRRSGFHVLWGERRGSLGCIQFAEKGLAPSPKNNSQIEPDELPPRVLIPSEWIARSQRHTKRQAAQVIQSTPACEC